MGSFDFLVKQKTDHIAMMTGIPGAGQNGGYELVKQSAVQLKAKMSNSKPSQHSDP